MKRQCAKCVALGIATVQGEIFALFHCTHTNELWANYNSDPNGSAVTTCPLPKAVKYSNPANWVEAVIKHALDAFHRLNLAQPFQL